MGPVMTGRLFLLVCVLLPALSPAVDAGTLAWPLACIPGVDCIRGASYIGYPDIDQSGVAFDCGKPGYPGHTGTDIPVSSVEAGVAVLAAADGEVAWAADGRFDHCPDDAEADCRRAALPLDFPTSDAPRSLGGPGSCNGSGDCNRFWGFDAGNYVLLRHGRGDGVAYTLYAHLRKGSVRVVVGELVRQGEKIAEAGSSGTSSTPHLHFGVWVRTGERVVLADPWAGRCSTPGAVSLWAFDPPYRADISVIKEGSGDGVVTGADGALSCGATCRATILPGKRVTLTAVPYAGSEFAGWEDGCRGGDPVCTLVAAGDLRLKVRFRAAVPPPGNPARGATPP